MKESNAGLYTTITIVRVVLLGAFIALSVVIGEDFAIPALITGGIAGSIILRGPLGKALAEKGEHEAAADAYAQGIRIAQAHGDIQAAKEMAVFARRLRKPPEGND